MAEHFITNFNGDEGEHSPAENRRVEGSEDEKYARPKPTSTSCTNQVSKVGNFVVSEISE